MPVGCNEVQSAAVNTDTNVERMNEKNIKLGRKKS